MATAAGTVPGPRLPSRLGPLALGFGFLAVLAVLAALPSLVGLGAGVEADLDPLLGAAFLLLGQVLQDLLVGGAEGWGARLRGQRRRARTALSSAAYRVTVAAR